MSSQQDKNISNDAGNDGDDKGKSTRSRKPRPPRLQTGNLGNIANPQTPNMTPKTPVSIHGGELLDARRLGRRKYPRQRSFTDMTLYPGNPRGTRPDRCASDVYDLVPHHG